jgi:cbb3-type cytochrome oxidase maturation protein
MLAILIPLGLVLVVIAVMILLWAVRDGQFEDLESPAWQIVLDDDASPEAQKTTKPSS